MTPEGPTAPSDRSTTVFVVGAGLMGAGIAAQSALAGYPVLLEDISEQLAAQGLARALRAIDHAVSRGEIDPGRRHAALARLTPTVGLPAAAGCLRAGDEQGHAVPGALLPR